MLKIEIIKFEAQDVITASVGESVHEHSFNFNRVHFHDDNFCVITACECGEENHYTLG